MYIEAILHLNLWKYYFCYCDGSKNGYARYNEECSMNSRIKQIYRHLSILPQTLKGKQRFNKIIFLRIV